MKKTLLLMALLGLFASACNTTTQEDDAPETYKIELNDGAKWQVNEEMKPFIDNGYALVKTYIESRDTDHLRLAKELKKQNDQLISSCTMKGQSHEELHKWLHPHLGLVKFLFQAEGEDAASNVVEDLRGSYVVYYQFFE